MKYCYKNEKNSASAVCYTFSFCLAVFGIALSFKLPFSWDKRTEIPEPFSEEWFSSVITLILAAAFIAWFGHLLHREALNYRRWHKLLAEKGTKYTGKVTEIIESSVVSQESDSRQTVYQFRVLYFADDIGINKDFVTDILGFCPDKDIQYSCDVYEIKEDIFEENAVTDKSLVKVEKNKITFRFDPIKLFKAVNSKSKQKWFGNVIADNFQKL